MKRSAYVNFTLAAALGLTLLAFQNCGQGIGQVPTEFGGAAELSSADQINVIPTPTPAGSVPTPTPTPSPTPYVVQNKWAPLVANINPPVARFGMASAWLGEKMLIVSGQGAAGNSTDADLYDPKTGVWTKALSISQGRFGAKAIWTGSKVYMFGGYSGTTRFRGEIYDPVLNSWSPMPETNPIAGRSHFSMVWTGSRIIVFGGYSPGTNITDIADGQSYDPATGTWTAISTVGAPSARQWINGVWTGKKMIIWGGGHCPATCGVSFYNNGSAYDPATNTWAPISTVGAPTAREGHVVVWTGKKMLVFGGDINAAEASVSDGAAYDPETDTWSPMSNVGAPASRTLGSAVWTGTQMIMWGGMNRVNGVRTGTATGGLYY